MLEIGPRRRASARARAWPLAAAVAVAASSLFAGCASVPREGAAWTSGRLSLRVDALGAQPAQSLSAAFELRGDGARGELKLLSPLGLQIASARWAPGRATLATSDGEREFGDLDELAIVALGEHVPLAALPDWLAGRAWGQAPSARDDAGFEQLGWRVDLRQHAEGRIVARRAAPPAVLLRVQLDAAAG